MSMCARASSVIGNTVSTTGRSMGIGTRRRDGEGRQDFLHELPHQRRSLGLAARPHHRADDLEPLPQHQPEVHLAATTKQVPDQHETTARKQRGQVLVAARGRPGSR